MNSHNNTQNPAHHLEPVRLDQRIAVVDILRGFAILGILVVNVLYFFNPWQASMGSGTTSDTVVLALTNTFFTSKFFTLFSFLFGLGMYIQMSRAEARGAPFLPVYLRRLFFLALFGLAHAFLLWTGDILFLYAVMGVITVLLFRKRSPRTLMVWAVVLIALPILFLGLATAGVQAARLAPPESNAFAEVQESFAAQTAEIDRRNEATIAAYQDTSWVRVTAFRFREFLSVTAPSALFMAPSVLGMFLLGLRAGKRRWFSHEETSVEVARRLVRYALPAGILLNLFVGLTGFEQNRLGIELLTWMHALQNAALAVGGVLLSLSYLALIVLAVRTPRGSTLLGHLAPVGRMALSNYILHSVVMSTLAYGYGAGLFGRLSLAWGFALAFLMFAVQIPLSAWWLRRFRYGPLEWLWRLLTYGAVPR